MSPARYKFIWLFSPVSFQFGSWSSPLIDSPAWVGLLGGVSFWQVISNECQVIFQFKSIFCQWVLSHYRRCLPDSWPIFNPLRQGLHRKNVTVEAYVHAKLFLIEAGANVGDPYPILKIFNKEMGWSPSLPVVRYIVLDYAYLITRRNYE